MRTRYQLVTVLATEEFLLARLDGVVLIPRARLERWIEEHLTSDGETDRLLDEIMADL